MANAKKVALGCDHGGFSLKADVIEEIKRLGFEVIDCGTNDGKTRVDYPDYAFKVCQKVLSGECGCGILMCGTGIGISIAANKLKGIRCGLCHDHYTALMCRQHNDANVLAIGGRTTGPEVAKEIIQTFLSASFAGQHHIPRLDKIAQLEQQQHL